MYSPPKLAALPLPHSCSNVFDRSQPAPPAKALTVTRCRRRLPLRPTIQMFRG